MAEMLTGKLRLNIVSEKPWQQLYKIMAEELARLFRDNM